VRIGPADVLGEGPDVNTEHRIAVEDFPRRPDHPAGMDRLLAGVGQLADLLVEEPDGTRQLGHVPLARRYGLAELHEQLVEECRDVGDDPEIGRNAAAVLGGLEVDLDIGRIRVRNGRRLPVRLHLLEPGPQTDEHVGVRERSLGDRVAVCPEASDHEGMILGHDAAAGQAGQQRGSKPLDEGCDAG
jgi:hypothetical protein